MLAVRLLRGLGETLVTFGMVVLLFVVYELFVTDIVNNRAQAQLRHHLEDVWAGERLHPGKAGNGLGKVEIGQGIAVLRIPRFGRSYAEVVVEGVATADLQRGPGHYPHTAMPGQVGNFVVSGHRTTYGKPFNRLDELHAGDPIVVETRDTWFTYRVTTTEIVLPSALEVIAAVPGHPGAVPTDKLLTFTTCNPKFSAAQRLIVHAKLTASDPVSSGLPTALVTGR